MIKVERVHEPTAEVVEAIRRLVPQLSTTARLPDQSAVEEMTHSAATTLLVARDDVDRIVGTLALVMFRIPTGIRAWIEDVIVDTDARGQGVGSALTQEALELARNAGARTVDLTSRPEREAANALYERVGFKKRETNVYRYTF